jgi:hypothetical protein
MTGHFVHVLLFCCPQCHAAIASVVEKPEKNPEATDPREFDLDCGCGWEGKSLGIGARRHWVEFWATD